MVFRGPRGPIRGPILLAHLYGRHEASIRLRPDLREVGLVLRALARSRRASAESAARPEAERRPLRWPDSTASRAGAPPPAGGRGPAAPSGPGRGDRDRRPG